MSGESGVMETGVALFDAFDGFPITGPKVDDKNVLTTSDLDECHGITSTVTLDGKAVTTYHYVMTQDFPYSVSCFRSTPVQAPPRLTLGLDAQLRLPARRRWPRRWAAR